MFIREAVEADWDQIWPIVKEEFATGTTYAYSPSINEDEAFDIWVVKTTKTYVAVENKEIIGTYYIKPNAPELGAHVCNCGYIVQPDARGKGVGRAMCAHSLKAAADLGFIAMQYNSVVSTNYGAIKLWIEMGFEIVGTLTKAYNHKEKGLVDAYVMYKLLE